jgi:acyl-CoA reductase-like NAD-dependent aldehyde dehydrogenase
VRGEWLRPFRDAHWEHRNPSNWDEILNVVPLGTTSDVQSAATTAASVQRAWHDESADQRAAKLGAWAEKLVQREDELVSLLAHEVGKPVTDGRAEVRRAVTMVRTTARLFAAEQVRLIASSPSVCARHRAVGVVGLVTPWNNPVAIPAGKIAAALSFGNGVVWKPALPAPRIAMAVMDTLLEAGFPPGLVNLVFGDARTVEHIVAAPDVAAVSLTGSNQTGRHVADLCARVGKPLQAELGGNNAAIVMADYEIAAVADSLALSAFRFAGQRCTATRRFIVDQRIRDNFDDALLAAVRRLKVGEPHDVDTHVGPLICREQQERVALLLSAGTRNGARILCGGAVPAQLPGGCWFEPTVVDCADSRDALVQDETFGPVAVIQTASDFDQALTVCNGVSHGLVASVYSNDERIQDRFVNFVEAGIVQVNPRAFEPHAEAPFGGWKASGVGPPEHGVWDREFFSRVQAVYGANGSGAHTPKS